MREKKPVMKIFFLTIFCGHIMRGTKGTVPYPAPNLCEPRQAHPVCSVSLDTSYDYTES